MDKLEHYKSLIKTLLEEEGSVQPAFGEIEPHLVFDDERGSYQLMYIGWERSGRTHGAVIHVRLKEGKIWIEYDGSQDGFATHLLEAGVPRKDIVLAFQSPWLRAQTEFALA